MENIFEMVAARNEVTVEEVKNEIRLCLKQAERNASKSKFQKSFLKAVFCGKEEPNEEIAVLLCKKILEKICI